MFTKYKLLLLIKITILSYPANQYYYYIFTLHITSTLYIEISWHTLTSERIYELYLKMTLSTRERKENGLVVPPVASTGSFLHKQDCAVCLNLLLPWHSVQPGANFQAVA